MGFCTMRSGPLAATIVLIAVALYGAALAVLPVEPSDLAMFEALIDAIEQPIRHARIVGRNVVPDPDEVVLGLGRTEDPRRS